jgi:Na+-driven multidrug efflux pump
MHSLPYRTECLQTQSRRAPPSSRLTFAPMQPTSAAASKGSAVPQPTESARFVEGSTLRHVVVMAGTGAIGLVAVFGVDLLNLLYLSLLGDPHIVAAVGFVGAVGFFQLSLSIGLTIGLGAVVSRHIGSGAVADARRIAASSLLAILLATAVVGIATVALLGPILDALAATGPTRALAVRFLTIVSPSLPLVAAGMCLSALLRSVGDARRALNVTLFAAIAAAMLDPLLIFGLHLGFTGAAISTVLSRMVMVATGWAGASRRHDLIGRVEGATVLPDLRLVFAIAGPAILTSLATPFGAAFVTRSMARFGAEAVAGQASIDRLTPVAFGLVFALTGAVGPILAQNLGAARHDRVRAALRDSLLFVLVAVCAAWLLLFVTQGLIVRVLGAHGAAVLLLRLFCTWLAGSFLFTGALFVANAAFNNLGFPLLSTLFNWGRATLGTIPLVAYGTHYGPEGVLTGAAAGSVVFGLAAVIVAFRVVGRLGGAADQDHPPAMPLTGNSDTAALAALTTRPAVPPRRPPAPHAAA